MLLEPGPLRLFAAAEIPAPGPRELLEGGAARDVSALDAEAGALLGLALDAAALERPQAVDLDLEAALDAHVRESREHDLAIGHVAAGVAAAEGQIAGLALDRDATADITLRPRVLDAEFYAQELSFEQARWWVVNVYKEEGPMPREAIVSHFKNDPQERARILLDLYTHGQLPDPAIVGEPGAVVAPLDAGAPEARTGEGGLPIGRGPAPTERT